MKQFYAYIFVLILLMLSFGALSEVRINGFASIVAGQDTDSKGFANSPYTDEIDFKPESKFALQVSADLSQGLSATAQIIARGSNDFDAQFEWAYLSYDLNDNHTIRAGKLRLPFYKYSDYLDVGYAYPWIRPPRAMYSLTFSTYEGLSLLSNFSLSDWDIASNLIYGNLDDTFFATTNPTEGKLKDIYGINIQASKDWFSAYIAYVGTDVYIPTSSIEGAAQIVELIAPSRGTEISLDYDYGDFLGLGFTVDYDNWLLNTEWSTVAIEESLTLDTEQWYVSLAYRFDSIMPYISYQETESKRKTLSISDALIPEQIVPTEPTLNNFLQSALDGQMFEYNAYTIGVKYDFHASAALKFEYNRFNDIVDIGSLGSFENPESSGNFSVAVDLVF
ncbi:porin [Pseudoalteromonas sp. C2R02]|uniref:porin n=1 Tax=Pseudoalteromonas sp. C2R02 TaxID=2841565 RepID=UPI001C090214|nr:porin [Pseudoalteromonas sp. C2R02]MBU2970523.1 porin [Pseudoalteromonas sp. C2R02]